MDSVPEGLKDLAYESVHAVFIEQKIKFGHSTHVRTLIVPNCVHALVMAIECEEGYHRDRQRIIIPGVRQMNVS